MADYGLLERNLLINRDLVDRECMGYRRVWVMTGMGYDRVDCRLSKTSPAVLGYVTLISLDTSVALVAHSSST